MKGYGKVSASLQRRGEVRKMWIVLSRPGLVGLWDPGMTTLLVPSRRGSNRVQRGSATRWSKNEKRKRTGAPPKWRGAAGPPPSKVAFAKVL